MRWYMVWYSQGRRLHGLAGWFGWPAGLIDDSISTAERCGVVPPEGATRPGEDFEPLGEWWGIWPRRSCDQSEVEMNVSSAPESGSRSGAGVWVQVWSWIWPARATQARPAKGS